MNDPCNNRVTRFGRLALVLVTMSLVGNNASAQETSKGRGPHPDLWPLNTHGLPKFAKPLAAGEVAMNLKNPSHFLAWVQVRSGDRALEFSLDGKDVKKMSLPNGEYTIFYRFKNDKRMHVGRSFVAEKEGIVFDDDKTKTKRSDADVEAKPGRKK